MRATLTHSLVSTPYKACNDDGGAIIRTGELAPWALLESLELYGYDFEENVLHAHSKLRSLRVVNATHPISFRLDRPHLEYLNLCTDSFKARSSDNINSSCPPLKKLVIGRKLARDTYDETFSRLLLTDEENGILGNRAWESGRA